MYNPSPYFVIYQLVPEPFIVSFVPFHSSKAVSRVSSLVIFTVIDEALTVVALSGVGDVKFIVGAVLSNELIAARTSILG